MTIALTRPTTLNATRDEIVWRHPTIPALPVDATAFSRFTNICSSTDVRDFARCYGVLKVCRHGKPSSHAPECRPLGSHGWFREPISVWLALSAQARALLAIASELRRTRLGPIADWQALGGAPGRTPTAVSTTNPWGIVTAPRSMYLRSDDGVRVEAGVPDLVDPAMAYQLEPHPQFEDVTDGHVASQIADERRRIALAATRWLMLGGAAVEVTWGKAMPEQVMTTRGLMGALTQQLVAHLVGERLVPCNECGQWATLPHRQGERAWCEVCRGLKRPEAAAARDYRARRRGARLARGS